MNDVNIAEIILADLSREGIPGNWEKLAEAAKNLMVDYGLRWRAPPPDKGEQARLMKLESSANFIYLGAVALFRENKVELYDPDNLGSTVIAASTLGIVIDLFVAASRAMVKRNESAANALFARIPEAISHLNIAKDGLLPRPKVVIGIVQDVFDHDREREKKLKQKLPQPIKNKIIQTMRLRAEPKTLN
jgi:hypothetical protein